MTSETITASAGDRRLIVAFERLQPNTADSGLELVRVRLPFVDRLHRDIEAYRRTPATDEERAVARQPVRFDLGDEVVDYEALYGHPE